MNKIPLGPIYSTMMAGSVINHSGDVEKSIFLISREVLHTDKLHTLVGLSADGLHAYFFALPSAALHESGKFETPLAAAFPGHPDHKGEGVYLLENEGFSCAIIKDGEKFQALTNKADVVLNYIHDLNLPVHNVEQAKPWALESAVGRYRRMADQFSVRTIKIGAVVTAAAAVIGLGAMVTEGVMAAQLRSDNTKTADQLNSVVMKIEHASPLSRQLAQFQKISSTVVRAGGWIDAYEMKGSNESFTVSLPEWVTQDYINALGTGTRADKDTANNIIRVVK
ncbi:hypothetical protein [Noviherbaspirillum suwonense]|uniref:Uncharacterized protein n=1 Tax=Noviherbaspirillum suwonense TaxID=1224511 RepID=A0ABY1QIZ4_9BURK|nr:hypothetical protein [Noviherbaspirillum suwonense]SMP72653.1 hypothetical protein SAMN06295970_11885 [Noviherbaspirillum suwonense]